MLIFFKPPIERTRFQAIGEENAITYDDIKDLRRTKDSTKRTKVFMFYQDIVPCLVGRREWEMKRAVTTISDIVTPSLEAMALWIIDNYGDKWSRKGGRTEKAKYTSVKQGNKLFGGWNESGIERFNSLVCLVRRNRREDTHFEKSFLTFCQEEEEKSEEKKFEAATENNVSCLDDLDDDDSSSGQGIAASHAKRYDVQVPSVVNVTDNFVAPYDVPSPALSITSRASSSRNTGAGSVHDTSGSIHGLYGSFGEAAKETHNTAAV